LAESGLASAASTPIYPSAHRNCLIGLQLTMRWKNSESESVDDYRSTKRSDDNLAMVPLA
jgi:hypothetical protein